MATLYRLYRPQKFADVTGQEHIIKTITNEIGAAKTAHSYLFSGPRGTGKTTLARLLAKSVNCQNRKEGEFEPCNECSSCKEISGGFNIDVIEIDAASHTGVDNVRENIIDNAQFQPTKAKSKVFIIDEVHMLSTSAFNALLKTLEEPPKHVIFVLATTELAKLPATIVSRCQRFAFKKIGFDPMLEYLQKVCADQDVKVNKKVLERVIGKSEGCMRDALSLLGQILTLNLKNIEPEDIEAILPTSNAKAVLDFIELVIGNKPKEAIDLIARINSEGANLEQFAYDALEILRLLLILQTDPTKDISADYSEDDGKIIKKLAKQLSPLQTIRMAESLIARRAEIKSAPIPQLPLELFAIEFANVSVDATIVIPNPVRPGRTGEESLSGDTGQRSPAGARDDKKESAFTQIKDKISAAISHKLTVGLETIKEKWSNIVEGLTAKNHSLGIILKMSELSRLDGDKLVVRVPYTLHKDKIDESKTKKMIEAELLSIFSEKILLDCEVSAPNETEDAQASEIASEFGGEVVAE